MAGTIYSENDVITDFETDLKNQLTMENALNLIVQASTDQSNELEVGIDYVQKSGVTWVVIQYDMDVNRMPVTGENVKVQSQGTFYTKNFANRRFWIRDMDDNILVQANSLWVSMDLNSRKMVKITEDTVRPYGSEHVRRIERQKRIGKLTTDQPIETSYDVRYTDIDFNGHVSNTHYANWMLNDLPFDFLNDHEITHFSIKFEEEVRFGDQVDCQSEIIERDGKPVTLHQIVVDGKVKSTGEATWEPFTKVEK